MSNSVKFVLKILIIIVAIAVAVFLIQVGYYYYKIKTGKINPDKEKFSAVENAPAQKIKINTSELLNYTAPWFGSNNPELTIVEFANYSCPYSKETAPTARELMLKYKDKIKFVYREFPTDDLYPESSALSLMSKCAQTQNKFWTLHDKMYQSANNNLTLLVKRAGLNEDEFWSCIKKQNYSENIKQDLLDGLKNGVVGTPTFFFIKKGHEDEPLKIEGAIPKKTFEEIIGKLLE